MNTIFVDFEKVKKVFNSCKNQNHLGVARNMYGLWLTKYAKELAMLKKKNSPVQAYYAPLLDELRNLVKMKEIEFLDNWHKKLSDKPA